ncbi:hypothetical protein [Helicobacter pylori]|uniref:hypothetical protein n=1 Tax=Helicobacter pylori TaxID=210 RepID=UPI0018832A40|nr:hypothetical protein [Helicobacter pylori]
MTRFFQNDKKTLSCYSVMLSSSLAHNYYRLFHQLITTAKKPYSSKSLVFMKRF